jgi:hypothetical protein
MVNKEMQVCQNLHRLQVDSLMKIVAEFGYAKFLHGATRVVCNGSDPSMTAESSRTVLDAELNLLANLAVLGLLDIQMETIRRESSGSSN